MIERFLDLRNRSHANEFRFDMTPELLKTHYLLGNGEEKANNVLKVMDNGSLSGYAIFSIDAVKGVKACRVLDICVEEEEVFAEIVDQLVERCVREDVDFIYFKQGKERFGDVLRKTGFFTVWESVIMVALLDPVELFSSISEEVQQGKILQVILTGFDPIALRIGKNGIQVVADERSDVTMSTDRKTFLRLLFGKTSLLKEVLKGKVSISSILEFPTTHRFLNLIQQKGWFIPSGDWL